MNCENYDFSIIGGDMRQVYMANELINRNFSVTTYGLDHSLLNTSCHLAKNLEDALYSGQIIITPIPISKDRIHIQSLKTQPDLAIDQLCNLLLPTHKLYGGCFTADLKNYCSSHNIFCYDLMEQEEVILFNSIATAEGALAEAITNSNINLHGSSCLITGYGRCARTLANKLKNLCGHMDIAARSPEALIAAYTDSFDTITFYELKDKIGQYDYIFNSVPALVITSELLDLTKPNTIIIDIASAPGGVDYTYAKEISRNARLCLGLPGKYAPNSSATFLINHILLNIGKK